MVKLDTLRLLITGGTGEVGSALIERIVSVSDAKLYLISRHEKISHSVFDLIKQGRIKFFKCDLRNPRAIRKIRGSLADAEIDFLIHLAGHISPSVNILQDAPNDVQLNVIGVANLLDCLFQSIKHITYSSSDSVYGKPFFLPVNEDCPTNPFLVYGAGKLATEKYLQIFAENNNVSLSILRITGVYGPNTPKQRAIPTFLTNVLQNKPPIIQGNGKTIRDYIHIDDVVQAIMLSIKHRANGIYNIGTGERQSIGNVAKYIIKSAGKNLKPIYLGGKNDSNFVFDISLAQKKLGFNPMKFKDGIRKEVERLMIASK